MTRAGQRVTRDGVQGKMVAVAPREGYLRFVPDSYQGHQGKHGKRK